MVSEIRIVLVVRFALDVNFVEIVERCSDTKNSEAQLNQNEEEQRDQDGRYKCEDYFLDGTASSSR